MNLEWDAVTLGPETVTLNLAGTPILLPDPLDRPVRALASLPHGPRTAAHAGSRWIFTGAMPGTHLTAGHLRNRLRPMFSSLAARLGTLTEISRDSPIAILAETLGYQPATLERHATMAAADYGAYVADLLD